jgi:hypothetical protein
MRCYKKKEFCGIYRMLVFVKWKYHYPYHCFLPCALILTMTNLQVLWSKLWNIL